MREWLRCRIAAQVQAGSQPSRTGNYERRTAVSRMPRATVGTEGLVSHLHLLENVLPWRQIGHREDIIR
jgi:hypothetical protein